VFTVRARPTVLLAVAILIATALAGCGESSDETSGASSVSNASSPSKPPPLSKAEFLVQANAVCRKVRAGIENEISSFVQQGNPEGKPREVRYADLAHFVLLPTVETEIASIYGLESPHPGRLRIEGILGAERRAIDEVATTKRLASVETVERYFVESGRQFRAFGLPSCANDRKPGGESNWPPVRL
jgi:hypothetical protein